MKKIFNFLLAGILVASCSSQKEKIHFSPFEIKMGDEKGKIDMGSGMFMDWSEEGGFQQGDKETGMNILPVDEKLFQAASIVLVLYFSGVKVGSSQ